MGSLIDILIIFSVLIISIQCLPSSSHCQKKLLPTVEKLSPNGQSIIERFDANGKACRLTVTNIPYCMGACKTGEYGTYTTEFRQQNSSMCGFVNPKFEEITMTCDEGIDPKINKIVRLIDSAVQCGCVAVPPKEV